MSTETTTDVNNEPTAEVEVTSTSEMSGESLEGFEDKFWDESQDSDDSEGTETTDKPEAENPQETPEEKPEEIKQLEPSRAEKRTHQLNDEIRNLAAQRTALEREVAQLQELRQAQAEIESSRVTPEQLMEEGLDEQDAQIQAIIHNQKIDAQQRAFNEIQSDIAELQYGLKLDAMELARDYPVFDQDSDEFDQEFSDIAFEIYKEASGLEFNADGQPISTNMKMYPFMQKLAEIRNKGFEAGSKQRTLALNKQNAAVMESGGGNSSSGDDTQDFVKNFFK